MHGVKGKIEKSYREHKQKFSELMLNQIFDLFAQAGGHMNKDNVRVFDCCLVKYEDKKFSQFDNGHLAMLEAIQADSMMGKFS